jgi:hypothetical protein
MQLAPPRSRPGSTAGMAASQAVNSPGFPTPELIIGKLKHSSLNPLGRLAVSKWRTVPDGFEAVGWNGLDWKVIESPTQTNETVIFRKKAGREPVASQYRRRRKLKTPLVDAFDEVEKFTESFSDVRC